MPTSVVFRNALLDLIFQNQDIPDIGDAGGLRGSVTAGSLYVSLHTADPNAGNQTTSEATYTPYTRVAVSRDALHWDVVANAIANVSAVAFPTCTSGSSTITHFGIGTSSSGAGMLLFTGALSVAFPVSVGIEPEFEAGDLTGTLT